LQEDDVGLAAVPAAEDFKMVHAGRLLLDEEGGLDMQQSLWRAATMKERTDAIVSTSLR
jgi:hypothetical protein